MLRKSDKAREMTWLVLEIEDGASHRPHYTFFETESEARKFADEQDTAGQGALTVYVAHVLLQTDGGDS